MTLLTLSGMKESVFFVHTFTVVALLPAKSIPHKKPTDYLQSNTIILSMTAKKLLLFASGIVTFLIGNHAYAWEHEISAGYGWGEEISESYQTRAFVLSGKLYKFPKIDNTLIATIDSSVSQLHADTPDHSNIITAAIALGLRAYFANPDLHKIRPYLGISSGPAYLSNSQLGERQQGANFDLQSTLEGGIEFGLKNQRSIDINLHLVHYCNAGLFEPNQGFNVPYVISIGYQF